MNALAESNIKITDALLVKVAREIAIEHFNIEDILKHYQINDETWNAIKVLPRFHELVASEIAAWQSATNTHERVKLKAAALVELWLEQANTELHAVTNGLPAKTELFKVVKDIAGMGTRAMGVEGGGGSKFSVVINLGADSQLRIDKELPPTIIEAEPVNA